VALLALVNHVVKFDFQAVLSFDQLQARITSTKADDLSRWQRTIVSEWSTIRDFASVAGSLNSAYTSHATLWVREQG
jgi:hypothetical protein